MFDSGYSRPIQTFYEVIMWGKFSCHLNANLCQITRLYVWMKGGVAECSVVKPYKVKIKCNLPKK